MIVDYKGQNDKKNIEGSNDEINKIIKATDKEIASAKDFLSSSSQKQSPPVPHKYVES